MKPTRAYSSAAPDLVLGLDIGANSIGWALVHMEDGQPHKLTATGVRVFEAGVEGDISKGLDTSRAAKRREARLRRRQLARRRHRLNKLAAILQRSGLLPSGDLEPADKAMAYWQALDRELFPTEARREEPHLLLYRLRTRALDEALTPYQIGRALYHLAHRRGFLSNRRVQTGARAKADEEEEGKVKTAIAGLKKEMAEAHSRTLGEYLSRLNPEDERVRNRYLGRAMLEDEFNLIWSAQAAHHPTLLTDDLKKAAHQAIFFQRPLKSARHLIGTCELEKRRPRAPMCSLSAQRFRLLQKLNDLRVVQPDGNKMPLTDEQRRTLLPVLESERHLSFTQAGKLLALPRRHKLNFETEGEKGLAGNRTAHDLAEVFGPERWSAFTTDQQDRVVLELRSMHDPKALARRATRLWGLDADTADRLSRVALEDAYCNLSLQALAKILPLMEDGLPFSTARKQLYGEEPPPQAVSSLPALERVLEVRNPAVQRALTELRKVVNSILRQHGKPSTIRIELARDLKRPRKERKAITDRNRANRDAREIAGNEIEDLVGPDPRRSDIEKWLLWKECGGHCPYTGNPISRDALFGPQPQFQVEHIIPLHRSLDDSFMNKTLCHVEENKRKGNRTPWEAYHGSPQWDDIIARVKAFRPTGGRGDNAARVKLNLFQTEDVRTLDDFTSQQLNDTRYASRLAVEYVARLYGAPATGVDPAGRKAVQASRGQVTRFLRDQWDLNFLGGGEKTRDDHRQHAIDAIVTALTTPAAIKRLGDAAAHAVEARRRRFAPMEPPWPGFLDQVRQAVDAMVVSHRVSRKASGPLHEETIYSPPHKDAEDKQWVHRRKPLEALSPADVSDIVDPAVRKCIHATLEALGQKNPAKAFKDPKNHPTMRARDGRAIPIHKVRLRESLSPERIGEGPHERHVKLGSNHHVEIIETTDKRGQPRWEGKVVSTLEAMRRLRHHLLVVQKDHGPHGRLAFSLAQGEAVELDSGTDGKRTMCIVAKVTQRGEGKRARATVGIVPANDARMSTSKAGDARDLKEPSPEVLRKANCRKVLVTPLGEVRRASD